MKPRFSQAQLNHMKELRESGNSQRTVGTMYDCHQKTIYYWESRAFVLTNNSTMFQTQGRYRSNSKYFVQQEELDKMKKLREQGMSQEMVAGLLGRAKVTVRSWERRSFLLGDQLPADHADRGELKTNSGSLSLVP
jgi:DNA-binding transcriptional regulator YiaG